MARMASVAQFQQSIALVAMTHKWNTSRATELQAIATALSSDTTKHDTTISKAPVQALQPGNVKNSKFTNDVLLVVNQGKAGNLTTTEMSNAITAGLSLFLPPVNTSTPAVTGATTVGSTLTCTKGNWTYVPTEYAYQWLRDATPIASATAATHVIVAGDAGHSLACRVTASNAAGSTPVTSNAVAVP